MGLEWLLEYIFSPIYIELDLESFFANWWSFDSPSASIIVYEGWVNERNTYILFGQTGRTMKFSSDEIYINLTC